MARKPSIIEKGLLAALHLAASRPWASLTLADIAKQAGLTLNDFHGVATRDDLALAMDAHFDRAMSAQSVSGDELPRERLFDVIMLRFEAMEPYREGLKSLMHYRDATLSLVLRLPAARRDTARWALASAGLDDDSGAPLALKTLAIAFVITRAERAWRRETSGDFALTMAALDKSLRAAEERMGWVSRFTGHAAPQADAPDAEAPQEKTE